MTLSSLRQIRAIRKQLKGRDKQKIVLDIGDNYLYIQSSLTNQIYRYVQFFIRKIGTNPQRGECQP